MIVFHSSTVLYNSHSAFVYMICIEEKVVLESLGEERWGRRGS